jgi:Galactose oxidase, central domain
MQARLPMKILMLASLFAAGAAGASTDPYWEAVVQHGDVPSPLWEAGAAFARNGGDPGVVYRFGGQNGTFPTDFTVNDFYAFDVATATWTNLTSPETPAARADTLLIPGPCGNCVSIVGGRGRFRTGSDLMFPEMWTYHVNSRHWDAVAPEDLGDPFVVRRSSALVVTVPEAGHPQKKTFYAFGGVGNTLPAFPTTAGGLRNDVAVYDKNVGWNAVPTFGDEPAPRAWATGAYDPGSHSLLIFGGYRLGPDQGPDTPSFELFGPTNFENDLWSLSLDTFTWLELEPDGPLPSPRDNVAAFFDATRGGLVIFGGQGFDALSNDLWFYSVADDEWTEIALAPSSPVPPPRVGGIFFVHETATAYELYVHSGATSEGGPTTLLDDMWKLTWPKN